MNFPAFDSAWYPEMIERFGGDDVHARAIVAGFCILAQQVDQLASEIKKIGDSGMIVHGVNKL